MDSPPNWALVRYGEYLYRTYGTPSSLWKFDLRVCLSL